MLALFSPARTRSRGGESLGALLWAELSCALRVIVSGGLDCEALGCQGPDGAPTRAPRAFPFGRRLYDILGLIVVQVCSDWQLAAISATKISNAVNLPPSAGGMPMRPTISPGSKFGSTWRDVGSIWPAALHSSNKFPTSTRPGERASALWRATGDAVVSPCHGSHAATY
jgi:hypothetical protein